MRRDRGFTLMELVLALALGATVVLMAHAAFTNVLDGVARAEAARRALDHEANARRLLAAAVQGMMVDPSLSDFRGGPDSAAFGTWLVGEQGWPCRFRVAVAVRGRDVVLDRRGRRTITLFTDVDRLRIDYLLRLGAAQQWITEWRSETSAPAALRFQVTDPGGIDTLLLVVGDRG